MFFAGLLARKKKTRVSKPAKNLIRLPARNHFRRITFFAGLLARKLLLRVSKPAKNVIRLLHRNHFRSLEPAAEHTWRGTLTFQRSSGVLLQVSGIPDIR